MTVIVLATIGLSVVVFLCVADHIFSNAVPRSELLGFSPSSNPEPAIIDPQTEPHTCGLHSLRSIYRAYGLNPDEHGLRERLGVDTPANPADPTSTGTLQPDISRVLAQDGFSIHALDLNGTNPAHQLESSLSQSHKALALIRKPDNGNLHWIVLQSGPIDHIEIIDSLSNTPRHENTDNFLNHQAITIFLLGVHQNADQNSIQTAHRLGAKEMKNTPARVKLLERR